MSLSKEEVQKIGKLARIALSEEEITHYAPELSKIFAWVEELQEINTEDVPQMASVGQMHLPEREDMVELDNTVDDVLANAPHSEYGYFLVPKVVE